MAKGEGVAKDESSPDLDQYAKDALDEIFGKEEQSYEEFVQSFMFLNKDDISRMKAHSSHSTSQNGSSSHDKTVINNVGIQSPLATKSKLTESDNIPEEVLGPGSTSVPILMRTPESSSGTILQVDNFVGCQDEESDTDDEESIQKVDSLLEDDILFSNNYSPSATSCSNSSKHKGVSNSNTQDLPPNIDIDTESHQAAKELCYLPGDVSSLPGEVDDCEMTEQQDDTAEVVVSPNIRQLQISTRINNCDRKNDQSSFTEEGEDTDEVQAFTLDTDFDYDNVALTPKFSFPPKQMP